MVSKLITQNVLLPSAFEGVELQRGQIPAEWLIEGNPETRSTVIGRSTDGTSYVTLWECGSVTMDWHYDRDEAIVILDGEAFLIDKNGFEQRYGPGDVILFPRGMQTRWRVPNYMRKVAFLKLNTPLPLAIATKVWNRAARLLKRSPSGH